MRIAVWHNLPSGGAKRALYGQVAGLVARGHHVEAWCPDTADSQYLPLSNLIKEHRLPFHLPIPSETFLAKATRRLEIGQSPLLAEMNHHSQRCAETMLRGEFDVVLTAPCRFYIVPRLGHFLKGKGLPVTLYLQEPYRPRYEAMPDLPWLSPLSTSSDKFFWRRWGRKFVDHRRNNRLRVEARREVEDARRYDLILVNSYFSRESIARVYGLDARVSYLSYDAEHFHRLDPVPPRERFVIGLGSMHAHKGVGTAIQAMARLPAPIPPLVWIANAEDPAYRREMEALAAEKQVDFQVHRSIQDDALAGWLNRASLLLYTSHLEPFGYAPIEANACGTPVVAVAEGGVRETVVDGVNGVLCDRDPAALASAMLRLLTQPGLIEEQGAAGAHMAVSRWSSAQSIIRLETLLHSVLKNNDAG